MASIFEMIQLAQAMQAREATRNIPYGGQYSLGETLGEGMKQFIPGMERGQNIAIERARRLLEERKFILEQEKFALEKRQEQAANDILKTMTGTDNAVQKSAINQLNFGNAKMPKMFSSASMMMNNYQRPPVTRSSKMNDILNQPEGYKKPTISIEPGKNVTIKYEPELTKEEISLKKRENIQTTSALTKKWAESLAIAKRKQVLEILNPGIDSSMELQNWRPSIEELNEVLPIAEAAANDNFDEVKRLMEESAAKTITETKEELAKIPPKKSMAEKLGGMYADFLKGAGKNKEEKKEETPVYKGKKKYSIIKE